MLLIIVKSPLHSSAPCRREHECDRASSRTAVLPGCPKRVARGPAANFSTQTNPVAPGRRVTWPRRAYPGHAGVAAPLLADQLRGWRRGSCFAHPWSGAEHASGFADNLGRSLSKRLVRVLLAGARTPSFAHNLERGPLLFAAVTACGRGREQEEARGRELQTTDPVGEDEAVGAGVACAREGSAYGHAGAAAPRDRDSRTSGNDAVAHPA